MSEHHNSAGHDAQPFVYRPAIFEQRSTGEIIRNFIRNSPYFMVAFAVNFSLLAFATVWKLGEDVARQEAPAITASLHSAPDDPKEPPAETRKEIFAGDDASVDEYDFEVETEEPELVFNTDFQYSSHNETNNGGDDDNAKGSSLDTNFANSMGESMFDVIGVGGISSRGGRAGYGRIGCGGDQNLTVREGKRNRVNDRRTESAVDAGLRWLARHQDANGSWSPDHFTKNCNGGTVCEHSKGFGYPEYETGNSGLALLAFLGAGYDHRAQGIITDPFTKKQIRMGDVVRRGVTYFKDRMDEAGNLCESTNGKWGYNHSIASLAMCEVYGLSKAPQWKFPAQKSIDALIAGQNLAPGGTGLSAWRYRPQSGDNDISVTGWAVMALKSAELAGLRTSQSSMDGAFQFAEEVTEKTTGHVGYTSREDAGKQVKAIGRNEDYANHPALAAVGMCIRTFARHNIDDPMLVAGAKLLVKDLPVYDKKARRNDYYYWYYGSLALNQLDGPESPGGGRLGLWCEWEAALKKALLENQVNNSKLCSDGSWDGDDRWGVDGGGRVYATAINTLTFEVYYRYGNAFGAVKKAPARAPNGR